MKVAKDRITAMLCCNAAGTDGITMPTALRVDIADGNFNADGIAS